MTFIDLTGKKFGRLTAIRRVENRGHRRPRPHWLFRCDCGNEVIRSAERVREGRTRSCGCAWVTPHKHGHSYDENGQQSRTYRAWANMKTRVRPGKEWSRYYADKGITVCERWEKDFRDFLADMGECPPGMTLDRINNDGNYEPGNCRWATTAEQNRNQSRTKLVPMKDDEICLMDACIRAGINYTTVRSRINNGMSIEEALSMAPLKRTRRKLSLDVMVLERGSEWMMY